MPNPLVTAVEGGRGRPSGGLRYDVTEFDYEVREFFFEGTARTYPPSQEPPADYRSRMIIWTPKDPARFNGTTVVEWAHVSVGPFELTYDIKVQSPLLMEQGYAFALVSAQEAGVCGADAQGCSDTSLRGVDPARYGTLEHPGENYSFDIFSQAMQAIKHPSGTAPLGNLATRFIIADGFQVQRDKFSPVGDPELDKPPFGASGPLNAYLANGAADDAGLADAFLIDGAAPLVEPASYPAPTLHYLDESAIRRTPAPNSPNHVTWEVVGAPHLARWAADHVETPAPGELPALLTRQEEEARRAQFDNFGLGPDCGRTTCAPARPSGTWLPRRYAFNAALAALREWLEAGVYPPTPPFMRRVESPPASASMKLQRDADGNAIGGLRLPTVQVPVATYNGEANVVGGVMTPFAPERLAQLYPTHESYVEQLLAATNESVAARLLLCRDAQTIMRVASASKIGGDDIFTATPDCAQ